jgi:hypothetical protein
MMTKRDMSDDYNPPPISPEEEARFMEELHSDPAMTHFRLEEILGTPLADAVMELTQDEESKKVLLAASSWLLRLDRLARFDAENGTARDGSSQILTAAFGDSLIADRALADYYDAKLAAEKKLLEQPV